MELLIERPRLREFVVEDHEAVHRYASDPEATRYTDWGPNDLKATEVFMAGAQASASDVPRTRHAGAIVRQDLNELIRSVELQITSQEIGYGVLGYVLGRHSWGKCYATKLPPECCDTASSSRGCDPSLVPATRATLHPLPF